MGLYIIRRLLWLIPTVFMISIISFAVIEIPPGDTMDQIMASMAAQLSPYELEAMTIQLREAYGLDKPAPYRYVKWIWGIFTRGDFGFSYTTRRPVTEIIGNRVWLTMAISLGTLLVTWIIALPIGVLSAVKQNSIFDYAATFVAFIGRAVPSFLLALVLMYVAFRAFGWSIGGLVSPKFREAPWSLAKVGDLAQHLVIPLIVIGTANTASLTRVLRGMMLDELNRDYVKTARAKGVSETSVIWRHAFRIAMLPVVSTIGWMLPAIISGEAIVSIVVNLPTTGASLLQALQNQDMYLAGSYILILGTLTVIGTLLSDILLAWIDPRIRFG